MGSTEKAVSRRGFLGGAVAGAQIIRPELVRGSGNTKLRAGIVGCGWRGTESIAELLGGNDDVELVAMGDLYRDKIEQSLKESKGKTRHGVIEHKIKVDREHIFLGYDSYKHVIASDIDLVILNTPPVYRPPHFEAAIAANKHVFMEKPLAVDPVGCRRVMATARRSRELNLTVGVGAQRRSQPEYVGTIEKIRNGEIGEILAAYAWWQGQLISRFPKRPSGMGDVEFQTRNWTRYQWLSGGQVVEQHIHTLDVVNWAMGTHPTKVVATGGRAWAPLDDAHGNNYDHLMAEFTYPNGVISIGQCRHYPENCYRHVGELVIGTKGRSNCRDLASKGPLHPKVQEQVNVVKSIRGQGPYVNLAMELADSTMTAIMARESGFSGQEITWDMIMASRQELMPPDVQSDPELGIPPLPEPGKYQLV